MIVDKVYRYKKSKIKQWPVVSNRASELGHECTRYLVFNRTRWQEKTLHDVTTQCIFDDGNMHEAAVIRDLQDSGLEIIEQQRSFEWRDYNITGHVDGKVILDGVAVPIEIKSASPFVYQTLECEFDLFNSKHPHIRRYPAQLTLYMLMDNKDRAFFIFKNKLTGELKEIEMHLDYSFGESLIKKAEAINRHVANDTIPECIPYDDKVCGRCGYQHVCLPEIKRNAIEIIDEPEMIAKIDRWHDLQTPYSEYNAINKEIKAIFKERDRIIVGDYIITGAWVEPKGKAKYWKTKINRLGVNNEREE
jgi:CRISPR/Cas system-associated exonuclease Cas4 (RecB family)